MKAISMEGFGSTDVLTLKELPTPSPNTGEVRIQVKAAGFNPIDWKIRSGYFGGPSQRVLGCECSGIVDAVGPNVQTFQVGDEVIALPFFRASNGSYAEYLCLPFELVAKKPRSLSFIEAAVIPLACTTAYRAIVATQLFRQDDIIFIAGLGGGVGSFAIQFARMANIKELYTVARNEESAQFLEQSLGLNPACILKYEGVELDKLKNLFLEKNRGSLFDATLDLVGGQMKRLCLELTRYSGQFSTILPEKPTFLPSAWAHEGIPFSRSLSLHLTSIGEELRSENRIYWKILQNQLCSIAEMFSQGKLVTPTTKSVGHLSVATAQEAHQLLQERRVKGKLAMEVSS